MDLPAYNFENVAIYLIGFPGVGKYTIAKTLSETVPFRLVDNHYINNPVFGVIEIDGITPLPERVWDNAKKIRDAVFDTIIHIAPRHLNYVLTNHLADDQGDCETYDAIKDAFAERESLFVPVTLTCDLDEHKRRIVSDSRKTRLKEINPEAPERYNAMGALEIEHPHKLTLDVTHITPENAVKTILDHTAQIRAA